LDFLRFIIIVVFIFAIASILAVYAYGRFAKSARGAKSFALQIVPGQTPLDKTLEHLAARQNGLGVEKDALSIVINNLDAFAARAVGAALSGRSLDLMLSKKITLTGDFLTLLKMVLRF